MSSMKQWHLIFKGRVQGVGFRFTVLQKAKSLGVCGWVKNLPNGDVEAVWEAQEEVLEALKSEIEHHFSGHIVDCQLQSRVGSGNFCGFRIDY